MSSQQQQAAADAAAVQAAVDAALSDLQTKFVALQRDKDVLQEQLDAQQADWSADRRQLETLQQQQPLVQQLQHERDRAVRQAEALQQQQQQSDERSDRVQVENDRLREEIRCV